MEYKVLPPVGRRWFPTDSPVISFVCGRKVHLRRRILASVMCVIGSVLLFRIGGLDEKKRTKICIHLFRPISFCSPSVDANWRNRFCYPQRVHRGTRTGTEKNFYIQACFALNFTLWRNLHLYYYYYYYYYCWSRLFWLTFRHRASSI